LTASKQIPQVSSVLVELSAFEFSGGAFSLSLSCEWDDFSEELTLNRRGLPTTREVLLLEIALLAEERVAPVLLLTALK